MKNFWLCRSFGGQCEFRDLQRWRLRQERFSIPRRWRSQMIPIPAVVAIIVVLYVLSAIKIPSCCRNCTGEHKTSRYMARVLSLRREFCKMCGNVLSRELSPPSMTCTGVALNRSPSLLVFQGQRHHPHHHDGDREHQN